MDKTIKQLINKRWPSKSPTIIKQRACPKLFTSSLLLNIYISDLHFTFTQTQVYRVADDFIFLFVDENWTLYI